jgi:hypothetical protein
MPLPSPRQLLARFLAFDRKGRGRTPDGRRHRLPFRLEYLEGRLAPATFTVLNTADGGAGSLRQAILDANANPGANRIAFDVSGGGVQTIRPASPLPDLTNPVVIDGSTQPGYAGMPLIELNGSAAGADANGLTLQGGGSTVKGLIVNGFAQTGVLLAGSGNQVQGNLIGTDATGRAALGNGGAGIDLGTGFGNTIGGTSPAARNVISANQGDGIAIFTPNDTIEGNYIGTDVTGTQALGNGGAGVLVNGNLMNPDLVANNVIGGIQPGAGNLISGNTGPGITLRYANNDRVQGNRIGTDVTGTTALGNQTGVLINGSYQTIGGATAGAGNLISGNGADGVNAQGDGNVIRGNFIGTDVTGTAVPGNGYDGLFVSGSNNVIGGAFGGGNLLSGNGDDGIVAQGDGNVFEGNFIGTDVTGTVALGNGFDGLMFSGSNNRLGGTTPGAGNVIAGNPGDGVVLFLPNGGNRLQGNRIGTDVTGTADLGNGGNGVVLLGSSGNTIGGTDAGAGNTIAFNGGDGVLLDTGSGNALLGNTLFANAGLGIDLSNGANNGQAAPALSSAVCGGDVLTVQGSFTGQASTTYTVQLFLSPNAPAQGQQLLGTVTVTTDASGLATFTLTFDPDAPPGQWVTATATDPGNNTSAFSQAVAVTG